MSEGRSFAKKEVLPDSERIAELDRKFTVIQERIQAYDRVLFEFEKVKDSLEARGIEFQKLTSHVKEANAKMQSSDVFTRNLIKPLDEALSFLAIALDNVKIEIKNVKADHAEKSSAIEAKLAKIPEDVKKVVEDKAGKWDFEQFKTYHDEKAKEVKRLMDAQDEVAENQKGKIDAIQRILQDKLDLLNEHGKTIQGLRLWINSIEGKIKDQLTFFQDAISTKQSSFQEEMKTALANAKEEILGTPTSNAQVENRILKKLDIASLDGSNAMRITRNNEDRIKLLEKKIEALSAQLTKYELPS